MQRAAGCGTLSSEGHLLYMALLRPAGCLLVSLGATLPLSLPQEPLAPYTAILHHLPHPASQLAEKLSCSWHRARTPGFSAKNPLVLIYNHSAPKSNLEDVCESCTLPGLAARQKQPGRGCLVVSISTVGTGHSECLTWSLHLPFFAVSLPLPDPAIQGVASLGWGEGAGDLRRALAALIACTTRICFGPEGDSWAAGTQPDSFLSRNCLSTILPTLLLSLSSWWAFTKPNKRKTCTVLSWLAPTAQGKTLFYCYFRILLPITGTCIAMADKNLMQAIAVI